MGDHIEIISYPIQISICLLLCMGFMDIARPFLNKSLRFLFIGFTSLSCRIFIILSFMVHICSCHVFLLYPMRHSIFILLDDFACRETGYPFSS